MKRFVGYVALAMLSLPVLQAGDPNDDAKWGKRKASVKAFFDSCAKEDYEAAAKDFNDAVRKALPPEKVKEMWQGLHKKLGPLKQQGPPKTETKGKYDIVMVVCQFDKLTLDARFTFSADGKIAGLGFVPTATTEYKAPNYVKRDTFREVEIKIGEGGPWELPGTLSIPIGDGPFPAVVLVHGSGPNDRDETILANKPFRDLAWGLSTRGIAVLRYEKRTRVHGEKMVGKDFPTVKEEVVDDALAAVALLRTRKEIDPKRVFVLGHSLGGLMAPRIGEQDVKIAGLIVLAGNTRPLEDLVLEQFTYLYSLEGPTEEQKAELQKIKDQVARVKDPNLAADTPGKELPLGVPGAYWLALREYHPAETAANLRMPMLIMQGERDYQVTMEDFALWKKHVSGRKNVSLRSYPKLNHLFMDGEGKAKPEEYMKAGHVAPAVIDEITAWLVKQ
jgi:dienelactone hydrolase